MSPPLIVPRNFDPTKISFQKIDRNKHGGRSIKIQYDGRSQILIQTPAVYLPFGLSVFAEQDSGKTSTTLEASLCSSAHDDDKMNKFVEVLHAIDNAVFEHCLENSTECFGKLVKRDVLEEFFRSVVKEGRPKRNPANEGDKWPPQMRVKISATTTPRVFDTDLNELEWKSELSSYARHTVKMILNVQPVWFVNKMFGVSIRLLQMIIVDAPSNDNGCLFVDDVSSWPDTLDVEEEVDGNDAYVDD